MKNSRNWKKSLSAVLAALLLTAAVPAVSAAEFSVSPVRSYSGKFTDVANNAWYYNDVADAYSLGLIDGKSESVFDPDGTLTIAQTAKLAAVCHQLCSTGKVDDSAFRSEGGAWYDGYVDYDKINGIVTEDYDDYNAAATRGQVAVFFSRAIMSAGLQLTEKNTIAAGGLKDVDSGRWYASAVYRLYRWGIMTGDNNGNINPDKPVKRSEISAVVMRVIHSADRITLVSGSSGSSGSSGGQADQSSQADQSRKITSLTLYEGSTAAKESPQNNGFAVDLSLKDGKPYPNGTYLLQLINHLVLEKDNISFRLYRNAGYESLAPMRGWLNEAARGVNGTAERGANETYDALNQLIYLWIGGVRQPITELWYADHGEYTTYAFYFGKEIDLSSAVDIQLACGKVDTEILRSSGMNSLADRLANAEPPAPLAEIITPTVVHDPAADTYEAALARVKNGAISVLFESVDDRATIVYGQGLNGSGAGQYRLILVFRDGTTQTIVDQAVNSIRVNSTGDILYYSLTSSDGDDLQYAVNLHN